MCNTVEQLHPFQSTRDLDGSYSDRETVQDIAFDGTTFADRIKHVLPQTRRRGMGSDKFRGICQDSVL
jgi:hypothetical protein